MRAPTWLHSVWRTAEANAEACGFGLASGFSRAEPLLDVGRGGVVVFDIVRDGAGRLQRELFVQSADAAPLVDHSVLFDSADGRHCRPRRSAGGMRCVPRTRLGFTNGTHRYSSDPECRIEALPISDERLACSDIMEDPDETCRTGAPRFFRVAGTSTRAYDLLDDCRPVTLPEPVTLFEPANLPRLTRVVHD